jgi:hypothetical protein
LISKYNQSRNKHPNWQGYGEISGSFYADIKRKAKKRGVKFKVSIKYLWILYLKQRRKCALSGVSILLPVNSKTNRNHTASLDRINSSKGYVLGNVQWTHKDVNLIKWHFDQKYFLTLCRQIVKYSNKKTTKTRKRSKIR